MDNSVAVKWFFPEIHGAHAQRLLELGHALNVPDLLASEFTNVLWKRVEFQQLSADEAREVLEDFDRFPLQVFPSPPLKSAALRLSIEGHHPAYDCFYLALALDIGCQCVTADQGFHRSFKTTYPEAMLWIEEVPPL